MFFKKKKQESELQKAVGQFGLDAVCQRCADVIALKLTTSKIYHQFILEELDSARQGNAFAKNFTEKLAGRMGLSEADYIGALDRSFPEVDGPGGPQQTLMAMAMQLLPDRDQVVEFRTRVVEILADRHDAESAEA